MKKIGVGVLAIIVSVAACKNDSDKASESQSGEEQGQGSPITLKSGIRALALTSSGLGLTGDGEGNLKALTESGELVFPFESIVNGMPEFEHVIVTDKQVLLAAKNSDYGLALTSQEKEEQEQEEGSKNQELVFMDLKMKEGESLEAWPSVARIDRATGRLQVPLEPGHYEREAELEKMYGLKGSKSSSISKYAVDGAGNFYYVAGGLSKIASNGEITKAFSGEATWVKALADGSIVFKGSEGKTTGLHWLKKDGSKSVVADNDYIWTEVVDGKLYSGDFRAVFRNGTEIVDLQEEVSASNLVATVVGANEAWVVYKEEIHRVYPEFAKVETSLSKIEAATSYQGKLVLVGAGKVLIDGEEVGTYSGTVKSISLKGSTLMIATSEDVTELDLETKAAKELGVGAVSVIEKL